MLLRIALVFVLAGAALACGDNKAPLVTIADYVRADSRLSTVEKGLEETELMDALEGPGPFTLFAFQDGEFDLGILDAAELAELMAYHIHEGDLGREALRRRTAVSTLGARDIFVRYGSSGILLNDGVKVVAESITAENGTIHLLDRALSRTLLTRVATIESEADLLVEGFARDVINVEEQGFVHELQVSLAIQQENISNIFAYLQNAETGAFVWLVRAPGSHLDDIEVKLADGAEHDIATDALREGEAAFPEVVYRPFDPLEYMVGQPAAGEWQLTVFNFGHDPVEEGESRLLRWGLHMTLADEMPAPAIVFNPRIAQPTALGQEFNEVAIVEARRVGGLVGAIEISGDTGDVIAEPSTIAEDESLGSLHFSVPKDTPVGPRKVSLAAQVGEVSRILEFDAVVASPRAQKMELLSHLPLPELGALGGSGSDIWGWTDPVTGKEIALVGTSEGTAFVDVSEPTDPVVLGLLPTETDSSIWRDIKVYKDHAFIVSEAADHGLQVFDLRILRAVSSQEVFSATATSDEFGNAHNIAINEESGTAYVVGSDYEGCSGGMLSFDISQPQEPVAIACFSGGVTNGQAAGPSYPTDVYTHDVQCVTYAGPDLDYQGREICFSSDTQSIGVADMSDPQSPSQIVRVTYDSVGYSHQGWLTEDHSFLVTNDEFDEIDLESKTRSYVWDMRDLDAPVLLGFIENPSYAVGHNTYIHEDLAYQANYASGLRLVDVAGIAEGETPEVAYYDTHPEDDEICRAEGACDQASFDGAWSSYPFFASGTLIVSDTIRGLFVLRHTP